MAGRVAGCRSSFARVPVSPLELRQYLLLISVAIKFDKTPGMYFPGLAGDDRSRGV